LYRGLRPREEGRAHFRRNGARCPRQKQYIALYVQKKGVLEDFRDKLSASSIGMSCIRFTNPDKIDFDVLKQLLRRAAKSK
jgi:hypothetical protein